jgi:hypothetical protein
VFVAAFACLTVQQVVSHGRTAHLAWTDHGRIDWVSIGSDLPAAAAR